MDGYAGSAMIDISNWYQNGYHLADLGKDENEIFGFLDYTEGSDYAQGLKNFAKNNNFNIENARFYSDGNRGFFMTKDREGMILTATHDGYGLTKENRSWNEKGGIVPIFIVMTPNGQTNTVIVRDSKTGKDLETVSIDGKTDETVPDIPDVPELNPAVATTDEPKEPKGENVDETLTTGVKGQDVTKTKQNNPVKPMVQDIKQPKQPVVQKVALNNPKATLPQTGERSSILLSVLGGLVALTGLLYLDKDRKNKKA